MIELFKDKKECCGCGACVNVCPRSAIHLQEDEYGFVYPQIDEELCIGCSLCKKVCAFQKAPQKYSPQKVYAVSGKNAELVERSSSGGVFAVLADYILEKNGCVVSSVLRKQNGNFHAEFDICLQKSTLYMFQGSKYLQSSTGNIFISVREKLLQNMVVLFVGTPCQVDALKSFLGKEFTNLLTIDLICHGVPSEKFFNSYIHYLEKKTQTIITDFKFRDKTDGWGLKIMRIDSLDLDQHNNKATYVSASDSSYYDSFLNARIYRENCYQCQYATKQRVGDITIGDYWGIEDAHPECLIQNGGTLEVQKGISVMLVNTEKGNMLFQRTCERFDFYESTYEKASARNSQLVHPMMLPKARKTLLKLYKYLGYEGVELYFGMRIPKKLIKDTLIRIGIWGNIR